MKNWMTKHLQMIVVSNYQWDHLSSAKDDTTKKPRQTTSILKSLRWSYIWITFHMFTSTRHLFCRFRKPRLPFQPDLSQVPMAVSLFCPIKKNMQCLKINVFPLYWVSYYKCLMYLRGKYLLKTPQINFPIRYVSSIQNFPKYFQI